MGDLQATSPAAEVSENEYYDALSQLPFFVDEEGSLTDDVIAEAAYSALSSLSQPVDTPQTATVPTPGMIAQDDIAYRYPFDARVQAPTVPPLRDTVPSPSGIKLPKASLWERATQIYSYASMCYYYSGMAMRYLTGLFALFPNSSDVLYVVTILVMLTFKIDSIKSVLTVATMCVLLCMDLAFAFATSLVALLMTCVLVLALSCFTTYLFLPILVLLLPLYGVLCKAHTRVWHTIIILGVYRVFYGLFELLNTLCDEQLKPQGDADVEKRKFKRKWKRYIPVVSILVVCVFSLLRTDVGAELITEYFVSDCSNKKLKRICSYLSQANAEQKQEFIRGQLRNLIPLNAGTDYEYASMIVNGDCTDKKVLYKRLDAIIGDALLGADDGKVTQGKLALVTTKVMNFKKIFTRESVILEDSSVKFILTSNPQLTSDGLAHLWALPHGMFIHLKGKYIPVRHEKGYTEFKSNFKLKGNVVVTAEAYYQVDRSGVITRTPFADEAGDGVDYENITLHNFEVVAPLYKRIQTHFRANLKYYVPFTILAFLVVFVLVMHGRKIRAQQSTIKELVKRETPPDNRKVVRFEDVKKKQMSKNDFGAATCNILVALSTLTKVIDRCDTTNLVECTAEYAARCNANRDYAGVSNAYALSIVNDPKNLARFKSIKTLPQYKQGSFMEKLKDNLLGKRLVLDDKTKVYYFQRSFWIFMMASDFTEHRIDFMRLSWAVFKEWTYWDRNDVSRKDFSAMYNMWRALDSNRVIVQKRKGGKRLDGFYSDSEGRIYSRQDEDEYRYIQHYSDYENEEDVIAYARSNGMDAYDRYSITDSSWGDMMDNYDEMRTAYHAYREQEIADYREIMDSDDEIQGSKPRPSPSAIVSKALKGKETSKRPINWNRLKKTEDVAVLMKTISKLVRNESFAADDLKKLRLFKNALDEYLLDAERLKASKPLAYAFLVNNAIGYKSLNGLFASPKVMTAQQLKESKKTPVSDAPRVQGALIFKENSPVRPTTYVCRELGTNVAVWKHPTDALKKYLTVSRHAWNKIEEPTTLTLYRKDQVGLVEKVVTVGDFLAFEDYDIGLVELLTPIKAARFLPSKLTKNEKVRFVSPKHPVPLHADVITSPENGAYTIVDLKTEDGDCGSVYLDRHNNVLGFHVALIGGNATFEKVHPLMADFFTAVMPKN